MLVEQFHRLPDLFPRRFAIDVVHLVQIDMVGLQPPQAVLAGLPDMECREPSLIRPVPHPAIDLRRQNHFFAAPAALREPPAENLLGDALADLPTIDIGGIEKVDLMLQSPIHYSEAVSLGCLGPEIHTSEAHATHAKPRSTEVDVLHDHVTREFIPLY